MQTVFSHIIQKRFSQVNEDVASDSLTYILNTSESAQIGLMKLLKSIVITIPNLHFEAQQTEDNIRPDIWGIDGIEPRVFIENKFWAGLTDNQPISYLNKLSEYPQPTILLFVCPAAREKTLWRELNHRLHKANIPRKPNGSTESRVTQFVVTSIGPILALTTWTKLLSIMELETADDLSAKSDLLQLRALCETADNDAFLPISSDEIIDQRIPAFLLQLAGIVQESVDLAVSKGILFVDGLRPQANWGRIGRYARFIDKDGFEFWFGINFSFWKSKGVSPLWIVFASGKYGRSNEVKQIFSSIKKNEFDVFSFFEKKNFMIAINIPCGEEKEHVINFIVDQLSSMAEILSSSKSDS